MTQGLPEFEQSWYAACELRTNLLNGGSLPFAAPGSVRLYPGEVLHADLSVRHDVWCGMNVSYTQSILAFGGPVMFTATLAASMIGNVVRRQRAEQLAAQQWRHYGTNPTLVTSQRVLTFSNNQWLSWSHDAVMEAWPSPREFSLMVLYAGADPVRFSGAPAPWLCVILCYLLYGPSFLAQHPEFGYMNKVAPHDAPQPSVGMSGERQREPGI